MMTRNIIKILHVVPMRNIMKVLYVVLCVFLLVFLMCVLVYAGRNIAPLSESGADALTYIALVALAFTGLIVVLAAIITGMVALYLRIFRPRVVENGSPK